MTLVVARSTIAAWSGMPERNIIAALLLFSGAAFAHDRHYAEKHPLTPKEKSWFDSLKSGQGPCCADADGNVLTDTDWESNDGHYRVRIDGKWIDVPDEAVLKQPNLYGPTMVWMGTYVNGVQSVRCFIPGQMT